MKPGLIRVVPPPAKGTARLEIKFKQALGHGKDYGKVRGQTGFYGRITIAREGWADVQQANGIIAEQWVKIYGT